MLVSLVTVDGSNTLFYIMEWRLTLYIWYMTVFEPFNQRNQRQLIRFFQRPVTPSDTGIHGKRGGLAQRGEGPARARWGVRWKTTSRCAALFATVP